MDTARSRGNFAELHMSESTSKNDLITFAGPIFDLILRLKAGIVAPSNELRPKIMGLLTDFEQRAERYRFNHKIIQVSKFALAALSMKRF